MTDIFETPIAGSDPNATLDLLLINSPLRPNYDEVAKSDYEVLPPLGEAYLASAAKQHGHNVGIIDAEYLGLGITQITKAINNHQSPRIAGINVLTPSRISALEFAAQLDPNIVLVVGGPHATALPEKTISEFQAVHSNTLLIAGEAEKPITQLLDGDDLAKVPGLWRIEDGEVKSNPNSVLKMDADAPVLDHSFLVNDPSIDSNTGVLETRVLTSRGCPFDCTFCAGSRSSTKSPVRNQSIQSLIDELTPLFNSYGAMGIRFVDDLFIASENRARTILETITEAGLPLVYWDATGRANLLSKFSEDTLDFLKDHGAHEIAIGIESGSERLRQRINKRVSEADIFSAVDRLTSKRINTKGYFIVGLPGETKLETLETFTLAKSLLNRGNGLFRASIFVFRPYPGTQEWQGLINQGYSIDQLLDMHADGSGSRAKHSVTTALTFGEIPPDKLNEMIRTYEEHQRNIIGKK